MWNNFKTVNFIRCKSYSTLSVYTYVKGEFAVKEIEKRSGRRNSETYEECESSKMFERFIFAIIVFIEQVLMYVGIGIEPFKPFDLNMKTFYVVNSL